MDLEEAKKRRFEYEPEAFDWLVAEVERLRHELLMAANPEYADNVCRNNCPEVVSRQAEVERLNTANYELQVEWERSRRELEELKTSYKSLQRELSALGKW